MESPYSKTGLADVFFQKEERIVRGYAALAIFEIWDQWSPWKQHVESLKKILAACGWSKNNPWGCVCNSNKLCSAGGKTATEGTHACVLWGATLSPLHTESCWKLFCLGHAFPWEVSEKWMHFCSCQHGPVEKSLWRDAQNNKTNSQRRESCVLPKAAKNPCHSHQIRGWHCKFQPVWLQNRVPNLPMPQSHVYLNWGTLQSDAYGLTVEANPWRPWAGAVQPFLMYTEPSGLTSVLAATHWTACNDTSLVHHSSFSEM